MSGEMVAMTADQASIRAEIFQRLDAYLDKSRREVRRKPARARRDPSHPNGTAPRLSRCDEFRAVVVPARLLDPTERALTVPDPFDTRRARSNLTSCTSSCDSPPPSASTAFRTVRTPARDADPRFTNATSTPSLLLLRFDNHRLADDRALAPFPPTRADVPQDVAVRDILETELPPLPADDRPDSRTTNPLDPPLTTRGAPHPTTPSSPTTEPFILAIDRRDPPAARHVQWSGSSTRNDGSSRRRRRSRRHRGDSH